jgi:hypothetical protein
MANITGLIKGIQRLTGPSVKLTLGKKQIMNSVSKGNTELAEKLAGYKNLKADVAYKASDRGYVVGAFNLRDGKQPIANIYGSITGAGTENSLIKLRGNFDDALKIRNWQDFAQNPTLQNAEFSSSLKNGIIKYSGKNGNARATDIEADLPKLAEIFGIKEEGALKVKKVDKLLSKVTKMARDLFAGKEVNIPSRNNKKEILKNFSDKDLMEAFNKLKDKMPKA